MDIEDPIGPPNSPVDNLNNTSKFQRNIFQMVSIFAIFAVSVILILLKSHDPELKILGVTLISNLSGVILGKLRTKKN